MCVKFDKELTESNERNKKKNHLKSPAEGKYSHTTKFFFSQKKLRAKLMNLIRYNMLSAQNQIIGASGKNVEG